MALEALAGLAHDALRAGATGLVALGTTGEPAALSAGERRAVVDVVATVCRERSAALAAAATVPVIVYHVPYRTGQHLCAAAVRRIAGLPGVAGIKYAAGAIGADTVELLADPPAGFAVLGGDDVLVSPLLAMGAHGAILASGQLATGDFAALVAAWRAGDTVRARELGRRLAALSAALFAEPNPTVLKGVLHALGRIPTAAVRLPLLPAGAGSVRTALRRLPDRPSAVDLAKTSGGAGQRATA